VLCVRMALIRSLVKLFRGNVQHLQTLPDGGAANGMQQVGFAHTHPTVQEKRVIRSGRFSATAMQAAWASRLLAPTTNFRMYNAG